jgi:hypothetical protein
MQKAAITVSEPIHPGLNVIKQTMPNAEKPMPKTRMYLSSYLLQKLLWARRPSRHV